MNIDKFIQKPVRSSAILTTSYVDGTVISDVHFQNQLNLYVDFTKGSLTSAEIKVSFAASRKYTLTYDNQSANFTVGAILTDETTGGTARIIADSDGGATGTLTLTELNGVLGTDFENNATISDSSGGAALASADIADATDWYQETASSITDGTETNTVLEHTIAATGKYRISVPLKDRYVLVSVKGTGTVTGSAMAVNAIVGWV